MAPEQAAGDGEGIDARADVYALGVMLYELLVGQLAQIGTTIEKLRARALAPNGDDSQRFLHDTLSELHANLTALENNERKAVEKRLVGPSGSSL